MPPHARKFPSFADGLRISYEEEISGEAFFTALAGYQSPANRDILLMFAAMERITTSAISPLVEKHAIAARDADDLRREGIAEARALSGKDWPALVASMIETYPVFVDEFRAIKALAPVEDRDGIDILIEHEQAMLSFAERQQQGDSDCTRPLLDFIARHGAP